MKTLLYLFLGLIQGVTEPLPISSSGHLVILKNIFNIDILKDLNFEIIVNFGSLIAIVLVYRKEIKKLLVNSFIHLKTKSAATKKDFRYVLLVILATIPAGTLGYIIKENSEELLTTPFIVGAALLFTALFLFSIKNIKGTKTDHKITVGDALRIGFFQAVALIPGISRSASTLTGALLSDLERKTAIKFSFMLYIPISIASFILGVTDINDLGSSWGYYLIGLLAATVATYFTTKWFINIVQKGKLGYFAIYCLILGIITILFI